ncbi:hypothetical protein CDD83_8279 [Cordyceps sp. RAO-2017]|nr:hypothetical protein CDD83_8279 [Cordyceps sp. RAO-2017]
MRRLLMQAAAATTALAETLGSASFAISAQGLSRVIGARHDLESVRNLPQYKLALLCMGTAANGTVDPAAVRVALGAEQAPASDMDDIGRYLEEQCRSGDPTTHVKAVQEDVWSKPFEHKICKILAKADETLNYTVLGDIAETLGFKDPFSRKFGRFMGAMCGLDLPKRPNREYRPVNPTSLTPDPCQAAIFIRPDGSFDLPDGCGEDVGPGFGSNRPGANRPGRGSIGANHLGSENNSASGRGKRDTGPGTSAFGQSSPSRRHGVSSNFGGRNFGGGGSRRGSD